MMELGFVRIVSDPIFPNSLLMKTSVSRIQYKTVAESLPPGFCGSDP